NTSSISCSNLHDSLLRLITKLSGFCISCAIPALNSPSEAIFSCWLICFLRRSNSFILSSFIVVAFLIHRNRNHKLGKVILFTFYDDGPLVVQDDFTTEVQTDTRSLGSGLRGEERFEYLGFDVVLDADAVIADAEKNCPVQSLFYVY